MNIYHNVYIYVYFSTFESQLAKYEVNTTLKP